MTFGQRLVLAAALCLLSGAAVAQATSADAAAPASPLRQQLQDRGLRLDATYTTELASNRQGGARQGTVRLGLLELRGQADGERLLGLPGLSATASVQRSHGSDPSTLVGDAQGVSSIAAPARWRLFEAWVEQNYAEQNLSLMVGRFDLNVEFYQLDSAGLFMHSSFGIGPELSQTGRGGPSLFPDTALSARLAWHQGPLTLRAAVLNGVPVAVPRADGRTGLHRPGDGALWVAEVALQGPAPLADVATTGRPLSVLGRAARSQMHDSKLALGLWHHGARFDDLARVDSGGQPLLRRGISGGYLIAEQLLWHDPALASHRLRGFVQFGRGDNRVSRFVAYRGLGLSLSSPWPSRPDDDLGLALAVARTSSGFAEQQRAAGVSPHAAESALELSYLATLQPWLKLQASAQQVRRPDTDSAPKAARLLQLRLDAAF